MAWQDQGRQEHGWFGHDRAGQKADGAAAQGGLFGRDGLDQRIEAIAYGAIASLPSSLRRRAEAESDAGTRSKLTEVMRAWIGGARLDQASFAERFFGRAPDDQIVAKLRAAAQGADMAESHAELRDAAGQLADAMQAVGLDRWRRFLADAQDRSRDPATIAVVEDSRMPSDPSKDAIRPVYPLETAAGIVATGIAGGAVAAARAVGGAILRQVLPAKPSGSLEGPGASISKRPNAGSQSPLPNAEHAQISPDKIEGYSLNPEHVSGRHKARVFESALGFNKGNADDLIGQIREGLTRNPAVLGRTDRYGQRFTVDMTIAGPKGSRVVRTSWIIEPGSTTPRLSTVFVK